MRSSSRIAQLPISALILGNRETVYPSLVWGEGRAMLVDSSYPGQAGLILEAAAALGAELPKISAIALTHQDIDHVGCVEALRERLGQVEVLCMGAERPYIDGSLRPIKLGVEAIERACASLPAGLPTETKAAFRARLENPPRSRVDRSLEDGARIGPAGCLIAVATPGHSPGHACYFHEPTGTLVAGDALRVEGGELLGPAKELCEDYGAAIASLRRLAEFRITAIICHHGGLFRGNADGRIAALASA